MVTYESEIMKRLQGETPKQKYEYLLKIIKDSFMPRAMVEYGYKHCEKGNSLQKALAEYDEITEIINQNEKIRFSNLIKSKKEREANENIRRTFMDRKDERVKNG